MSVPRMHPDDLERIADLTAQRVGSRSAPAAAPLLDAKAAAQLLGVPPSWVAAEARADRIPHVRLGRYVRFEGDQLEAWWRSRARGPWRSASIAATSARASEAGARPASAGSDAP
jgi:excisionase family DNA binding protein